MTDPRRRAVAVPGPGPVMRPDVVSVDLESSGLHKGAYPIEFGWADDALQGGSFLIRPTPYFPRGQWSWEAEQVHGITWEMANDEGLPVPDAIERIAAVVLGKRWVLSDSSTHETKWIRRLYEAASVPMPFVFTDQEALLGDALLRTGPEDTAMDRYWEASDLAERGFPRPHRAFPDALCNAALLRMCLDPAYADAVRDALAARTPGGVGPGASPRLPF